MIRELSIEMLEEVRSTLENCCFEEELLIEEIKKADRIFVAGVGRTGYIMRCFSMRLMHAGFKSFMIGDTETPGAGKGDLLIIGSGSGETESLKSYVRKAKKISMRIVVLTASDKSTLSDAADILCILPAPNKTDIIDKKKSIQPMGALFEQSLLVLLDALVIRIMEECGISGEEMYRNHANLE
ncbi:6-phospho-3-hexuloisomerase [Kineothrix sp. MB12-C1]|uniref:6-phospho-3-hexuloisomerase n=1 Tax=Kineothrix sp. MB12-C1 TaxID=3070215 RepID=UPI0027D320FD|nr:6-phospho-3-hexuloisomerase [Kineothrix sp. MB12-C1]WMC93992.1 6-phospho-3-hexuloisomerase [Kineothrix sp. MB12-C1]